MENKSFWKKFTENKKLFWGVIGGAAALLVIAGVVLALTLGGGAEMNGCAVTVKTQGGMALEGVGVYIYEAADKKEMVSFAKTDAEGKASFTETIPAGSVIVLEDVPAGYAVAENYPVKETTEIVLASQLLKEMSAITLGGIMFDFTVQDTEGTEYTLSELLKEKKAVVLNLWYTNCGPCKAEFPFLQEAYDAYSNDIALLALNPVAEDDEAAVKTFKTDNGLTFPMAKVDAKWAEQIQGIAYPTTVVIDRYGMVALIHIGGIDDAKTFEDMFAFFTAEGYTQKTVADLDDLQAEASAQGTQENPFEFGGVTEFEVTVKPGEKVYCDVYKVSDMQMTITDAAATVTFEDTEYKPEDGVVRLMVHSEDTFTPVKVAIGNTSSEEKTFKAVFTFLPGTVGNPIAAELGEFTAKIEAGNEQGIYYIFKAAENGTLTLACTKATEKVNYDFTLYNLNTYKQLTYGENGFKTEEGKYPAVSIPVNAGDEVQYIISALPNEENEYPAAELTFNASFVKGEGSNSGSSGNSGSNSGSSGSSNSGSSGSSGNSGNTGSNSGSSGSSGNSGGSTLTEYEELYVGKAYYVKAGETAISLSSGDNFFIYTPEKAGKYEVKVSSGKVAYWGGNTVGYIADQSKSESVLKKSSSSFTLNFLKGQVGSVILINVQGSGSATLTITRTGNSIEEKPWTVYTGLMKPTSQYTYEGGALKVVDITGSTVKIVADSKGYYHWGSVDGPQIYVKLNDKDGKNGYLSFDEWLNSERPIIKAAVGSGSSEKKWDFTDCMKAYNKYKDKTTGYYPLNEDLKFILQTLYVSSQWEETLFSEVKNLNEDMAWMFCCYYAQ